MILLLSGQALILQQDQEAKRINWAIKKQAAVSGRLLQKNQFKINTPLTVSIKFDLRPQLHNKGGFIWF